MKEFISNVLGGNTLGGFLSNYFFAIMGAVVILLYQVLKRDPASPHSPFKFSLNFLTYDNAGRLILNAILIFIAIRFFKNITGVDLVAWGAFLVGFGSDGIMTVLQKFNILDTGKTLEKFQAKKPENENIV